MSSSKPLSQPQRRILRALATQSPQELKSFNAAAVRSLEARGFVRIEYRGTEARCPRSGVMTHTSLPAHLHLTDEGRDAEFCDRTGAGR